jgi:hypothetical protein
MVLAFCTLVMVIGCDTPANDTGTDNYVSPEENIVASEPSVTTIYKDRDPTSVTIEAARGFTCQWFVDGKPRGTNTAITLDSANLSTGDHFVTLIASKNEIPYSREFIITVIRQF